MEIDGVCVLGCLGGVAVIFLRTITGCRLVTFFISLIFTHLLIRITYNNSKNLELITNNTSPFSIFEINQILTITTTA